MDYTLQFQHVIEKLKHNERFGLFERGQICCFEDGTRVDYSTIWRAMKEVYPAELIRHKTMAQICPDSFVGSFSHTFARHDWIRSTRKSTIKNILQILSSRRN